MTTRIRGTAIALALFMSLATPATAEPVVKSTTINITLDDVRAAAQGSPELSRKKIFSIESNVRLQAEDLYLRRALAERARQQKLDADPIIAAQLRQIQDRLLSDLLLQQTLRAATPDPQRLTEYARQLYQSQPERYRTGEQIKARHILIMRTEQGDPKAAAATLLTQIKEGASFEALARANSADQGTASNGGDLGWFAPEVMVKEFQAALAALAKPGELSDVIETQFGFHIIRLEGRRPAGLRTFDEVREQIERDLLARNQTEARQLLTRQLLKDAEVNNQLISELAAEFGRTSKP